MPIPGAITVKRKWQKGTLAYLGSLMSCLLGWVEACLARCPQCYSGSVNKEWLFVTILHRYFYSNMFLEIS